MYDYFYILGVPRDADPGAIDAAYQKIKATSQNYQKMKKKAYQILNSPRLCSLYLNLLASNAVKEGEPLSEIQEKNINEALVSYAHESLSFARREVEKEIQNYENLKIYLDDARPFFSQEIQELLKECEKKAAQDFLEEKDIDLEKPLATIAPWSKKDMSLYYSYWNDNKEIRSALLNRRITISYYHYCATFLDDYQLIRDKDKDAKEKNQQLTSILRKQQEKNNVFFNGEHYLTMLIQLLDHLRQKLKLHAESGENKNTKIDADLIRRIDVINSEIARYFSRKIINFKVENNEVLKKIIIAIGQQNAEIFPWLSIFFRKELESNPEKEELYLESFLKFSALSQTIAQEPKNEKTISVNPQIQQSNKTILGQELKILKKFRQLPLNARLKQIEDYLLNHYLSDNVMLNICIDLINEYKQDQANHYLNFLLFKCVERVYQDSYYLPEAADYLHAFKFNLNEQYFGLSFALMQDNLADAIILAMQLKLLVPSATIFYAVLGKFGPEAIEEISQIYDKKSLIRIFSAIFADEKFSDNHFLFITSDLASNIGLNKMDFPEILLKSTTDKSKLGRIWEAVLDKKLMTTTTFLKKNAELFSQLQELQGQLLDPVKIRKYPARYRELCLALAFYRSLHASPFQLPFFGFHFGFPENTNWAEEWFLEILKVIAYDENQEINFKAILEFVKLEFSIPSHDTENKVLEENALQDKLEQSHVQTLLHGITRQFIEAELQLTAEQIRRIDSYAAHYPSEFSSWRDILASSCQLAIPKYMPIHQQSYFLALLASKTNSDAIINLGFTLLDVGKHFFSEPRNELYSCNKLDKALYFLSSLYLAYCEEKLKQDKTLDAATKKTYFNYVLYAKNPYMESCYAISQRTTQYFENWFAKYREEQSKNQNPASSVFSGIWLLMRPAKKDFSEKRKVEIQRECWEQIREEWKVCQLDLLDENKLNQLISKVKKFRKEPTASADLSTLLDEFHVKLLDLKQWIKDKKQTSYNKPLSMFSQAAIDKQEDGLINSRPSKRLKLEEGSGKGKERAEEIDEEMEYIEYKEGLGMNG